MADLTGIPPLLTKPLLKRGVTIELDDGTTLALNRETASKLDHIRRLLEHALFLIPEKDQDKAYDQLLPVNDYPAQYVRQYLALMDKIDKKAKLPDIRLSRLFDLYFMARFLDNTISIANIPNYIFATILANQPMSKEMKQVVRETYLKLPVQLRKFIMNRLDELNQTLSLKNVRNLNITGEFFGLHKTSQRVAVDNQGKILLLYEKEDRRIYYDETDGEREKLINSRPDDFSIKLRIGGVTKEGIIVIEETDATITGHRNLIKYLPGQAEGQLIATGLYYDTFWEVSPHNDTFWEVSPHSSRLLVVNENGMINIYDLADNILIFQYEIRGHQMENPVFRFESYTMDDWGKYLLLTYHFDDPKKGMLVELFAIGKTVSGSDRTNELMFEVLIPIWTKDREIAIDPYRQLVYVVYYPGHYTSIRVTRPDGTGYDISIILVINFKGQVLYRYANPKFDEFRFYTTANQLLTQEAEYGDPFGRHSPLMFGMEKEDLQYIEPLASYSQLEGMMVKLPAYQIWPNLSGLSYRTMLRGNVHSHNFWIRDTTNGFKGVALVKKNTIIFNRAVSSASGNYVVTIEQQINDNQYKLSVMQTVLYTDDEVKAIRNILEGGD